MRPNRTHRSSCRPEALCQQQPCWSGASHSNHAVPSNTQPGTRHACKQSCSAWHTAIVQRAADTQHACIQDGQATASLPSLQTGALVQPSRCMQPTNPSRTQQAPYRWPDWEQHARSSVQEVASGKMTCWVPVEQEHVFRLKRSMGTQCQPAARPSVDVQPVEALRTSTNTTCCCWHNSQGLRQQAGTHTQRPPRHQGAHASVTQGSPAQCAACQQPRRDNRARRKASPARQSALLHPTAGCNRWR